MEEDIVAVETSGVCYRGMYVDKKPKVDKILNA